MIAALVLQFALVSSLATPGCYPPPVADPIVEHFRAPACTWCPGNRGVDYAVQPGTWVHSLASGIVTFAGAVAGSRWVVVAHDDGLRSSFGELDTVLVTVGDRVTAGRVLGTTGARLHLGLRDGDTYLDPEPHLARRFDRVRLVPTDGSPARPGPPPQFHCPTWPIAR